MPAIGHAGGSRRESPRHRDSAACPRYIARPDRRRRSYCHGQRKHRPPNIGFSDRAGQRAQIVAHRLFQTGIAGHRAPPANPVPEGRDAPGFCRSATGQSRRVCGLSSWPVRQGQRQPALRSAERCVCGCSISRGPASAGAASAGAVSAGAAGSTLTAPAVVSAGAGAVAAGAVSATGDSSGAVPEDTNQ